MNNEWYTPSCYVESARYVMGSIDLDPASCEYANSIVKATTYYTVEDDGLSHTWSGNVWMNPPYSTDLISRFTDKLIYHTTGAQIRSAVVLTNNCTETRWFQSLVHLSSAICFPKKRIRYIGRDGKTADSPRYGQTFFYVGENIGNFVDEFSNYGIVLLTKKSSDRFFLVDSA